MAALPPSPNSYKSLVYQRTLLDRLNFLRNLGLFCDVTLEVEGKLFRCHQVILAASSTFFQTLFTQQQAAIKQARPIDLPVVKATAFCQLLDFVYTSELSLTVQTAIDLLSAASLLQMGPLVEAVSHYLKTHVGDEPDKPLPPLSSASGPGHLLPSPPAPASSSAHLNQQLHTPVGSSTHMDTHLHTPTSREPSAFVLHDSGQYVQQDSRGHQTSTSTPSPTPPHAVGHFSPRANLRLSPNADKGRAPLDYGPPLVMPPMPTHQPGFRYGVRSLDGKGGVFPVPIEVGNPYNRRHEQRFECHVCYMKFTRSETLRDHMNIHTGEKPYSCKFCHKKFRHQRNLRTHERDCKDNKGSKWRRKYTETVKDALERIRSEKTPEQEGSEVTGESGKVTGQDSAVDLEGDVCLDTSDEVQRSNDDDGTLTVQDVQRHEEFRGQDDEPVDLQEDRRSTPDSLGGEHNLEIDETSPDITMAAGDGSPDVAMEMGDQNPDVAMATGDHVSDMCLSGAEEAGLPADQLEYIQRLQSLNQHGTPANRIRKHEARYSCPICLQTFTRSHNLKNHMLIHSDAKPFTCPRCSGEFRYKRNLKAHSSVCKGVISVQNTAHPARSMSGSEPDLDAPADGAGFSGLRDLLTSDDPEDQVEGSGEAKEHDVVFSPSHEEYHSPEDNGKAPSCTYIRGQDGRIIAVKQESPSSPANGRSEPSEHGSRDENVWGENSAEERPGSTEGSVEQVVRTPGGETTAVGGARKRKAGVQHRWDSKHPSVARLPEQLQSYVMEMMAGGEEGRGAQGSHPAGQLEQGALSQNENQIIKDFWAEVNRGLFPDDHFSGLGHLGAKGAEVTADQWQGSRTRGHRQHLEIQTSPSIDPLRDGGSPLLESDSSVVQDWAGDKSAGRKKQNGTRLGRSKVRGEQETFDPKKVKVETQDNA